MLDTLTFEKLHTNTNDNDFHDQYIIISKATKHDYNRVRGTTGDLCFLKIHESIGLNA